MPHPHVHSPSYAPPVLRPPSPASSLGTSYAPDTTSLSDTEPELSQAAFEQKCNAKLRLDREFAREWNISEGFDEDGFDPEQEVDEEEWERLVRLRDRDREREGWGRGPLLAPGEGPRTPAEDNYIHEKILRSLRYQIHLLEENELFEQTLLRGSQAALETQPTSNDIDTLMRSMMTLTPSSPAKNNNDAPRDHGVRTGYATANTTATAGTITNGPWSRGLGMGAEGADVSTTPRRRSLAKGKGRSQR